MRIVTVAALLLAAALSSSARVAMAQDAEDDDAADGDVEITDAPIDAAAGDAAAAAAAAASSDDAGRKRGSDVHPLTDIPPSHPRVSFSHLLPALPDGRSELGKPVDSVFTVFNDAGSDVRILSVAGSINQPMDFSQYLQNFTLIGYNVSIADGNEGSFLYRFGPSSAFDTTDYALALTCFYVVDNGVYATTFYNGSIAFYDTNAVLDFGTVFSSVFYLFVAAAILLGLKIATDPPVSATDKSAVDKLLAAIPVQAIQKKSEAAQSADEDDWLIADRKRARARPAKSSTAAATSSPPSSSTKPAAAVAPAASASGSSGKKSGSK